MKVTLTGPNDTIWTQEVSGDLDLATIKMLSAVDLGLNFENMMILRNGAPLLNDAMTLTAAGVADGDILMALPNGFANRTAGQNPSRRAGQRDWTQPANWDEKAQEVLTRFYQQSEENQRAALGNFNGWTQMQDAIRAKNVTQIAQLMKERHDREKAEADRLRQAEANPMDPANQKYLEERIQQQNIDDSYRTAMESHPEMFGTVIMLYINCKVNGKPVKAFVDSGAQMTIMSQACAERCNCMRLLDTRFSGVAKGVGTQKILGRVHTGQIQINDAFIPQSFSVMEDQPMDLLIGLDMLKRHQCILNLAENSLTIGSTGTVVKFLSEGELEANARLSGPEHEARVQEEMEIEKAMEASKSENSRPGSASTSTAPAPSAGPSAPVSDPKVQQIISMTKCTADQAAAALVKSGGDPNAAALSILTSCFKK